MFVSFFRVFYLFQMSISYQTYFFSNIFSHSLVYLLTLIKSFGVPNFIKSHLSGFV